MSDHTEQACSPAVTLLSPETDRSGSVSDVVMERETGTSVADMEFLQCILEGALLAADRPLSLSQLADLFEPSERPGLDMLREALQRIRAFYEHRGIQLQEVASGYRFQVIAAVAPWVSRLWEEKPQRYSRALLETLALIAYRQPITRGDIEEIRGVAVSSNIVRTLMEREWIRIVGHKDVPGRPAMYATTRKFLDYFNLKNLSDLPPLAELRDLDTLATELDLQDVAMPGVEAGHAEEIGKEESETGGEGRDGVVPGSMPTATQEVESQERVNVVIQDDPGLAGAGEQPAEMADAMSAADALGKYHDDD